MAAEGKFSANFGDDDKLVLSKAVLIYRNNNTAYATVHDPYTDKQGQSALGEGSPLTHATIAGMVRDFSNNAQVGSFLAPNVLSIGMDSLVWWVKPAMREIHFACSGNHGIGTESGVVPHPGLIFAVGQDSWSVFAVKGNSRPKATTPLFQAPHFNIWAGGKICTGNVTLPKDFSVESMAAWEKAYFGSRFSHPNVPVLVNYEGGSYPFWRSMLDGKFSKFPQEVLVPEKLTASDLVRRINGGAR